MRQVKDPHNKNFTSPKKEIEEDIRKLKDLPCSWICRNNIVKIAILPKAIYRLNVIPIKNSNTIFIDFEGAITNFIRKNDPRNPKQS